MLSSLSIFISRIFGFKLKLFWCFNNCISKYTHRGIILKKQTKNKVYDGSVKQ